MFGDPRVRLESLRNHVREEQRLQAEEKRLLETAVRRIVREEIRAVTDELRDRLLDPLSEGAVTVLDDVRYRLEARWADDGHGPGSTV